LGVLWFDKEANSSEDPDENRTASFLDLLEKKIFPIKMAIVVYLKKEKYSVNCMKYYLIDMTQYLPLTGGGVTFSANGFNFSRVSWRNTGGWIKESSS